MKHVAGEFHNERTLEALIRRVAKRYGFSAGNAIAECLAARQYVQANVEREQQRKRERDPLYRAKQLRRLADAEQADS